jgi:hypothetical protein
MRLHLISVKCIIITQVEGFSWKRKRWKGLGDVVNSTDLELKMDQPRIITQRHDQSLKHALHVLKKDFFEYIDRIYLYGSCARSQQRYSSDVDLLVVVSEDTPSRVMGQLSFAGNNRVLP